VLAITAPNPDHKRATEVAMADRIEARRRRIVSAPVSTPPEVDWPAQATLERQQRDQQYKQSRIETQAEAKRQHAATSPLADLRATLGMTRRSEM
jgi:hypothetical protein